MCYTLLEATEGAARIASTVVTNVVTDKLEFVKGMLTSPLQTINKEYIQPVIKKIGTLLGKACYLACTDPERLRNGAVARFNQVLSAAKTKPEAFIVAAGELLGNNALKKIANLQTLQKAAKAAGRGNRFGKVVTEVGKKSQEAKEAIAYPFTAIAEKAKSKCNEALRKGKQQKPQRAINKSTTLISGEQILDKVKTYEQARNKALNIIGDLGSSSQPVLGRLKTSKGCGKIIGRQSIDGKVKWRLDWDTQKGMHINVEDFRAGKGKNAVKIVIPFEGDELTFVSLLKHLNRSE